MKYNCDARRDAKKARRQAKRDALWQWQRHFAWFPVKIRHGLCVWLEYYEARLFDFDPEGWSRDGNGIGWQYREIENEDNTHLAHIRDR